MINFRLIEGAKDSKQANFEDMCSQLMVAKFPGAQPVEGKGGDGGCDLFLCPNTPFHWYDLRVFQYKYFCDTLTASQKRQIEVSLQQAITHWRPWSWVLCMPKNLTPAEHRWFHELEKASCDAWKAKDRPREKLCFMEFWGETLLRSLLAEFPHIRGQFFPVRFSPEQELQIRKVVTEIVAELPEELAFISKIKRIAGRSGLAPVALEFDIVDWVASREKVLDSILGRMLRLDYSQAEIELREWSPESDRDNALKWLLLGNCLFALGKYRMATDAYAHCLTFPYYFVNSHNNRGVSYRRMGDLDIAVSDFDAAIGIDPSLAEPFANRGVARKLLGQHELAKADLDQAISLRDDFFEAYYNRALVQAALGNFAAAMDDFAKARPILQELHWLGVFKTADSDHAATSLAAVLEAHAHDVGRALSPYAAYGKAFVLGPLLANVHPADISSLRRFLRKYVERLEREKRRFSL
jgi:tetratricopeptide (TPR) repeat protein